MAMAANHLRDVGGGLAVYDPADGITALPLPIAGLLSDRPLETVAERFEEVQAAARTIGTTLQGGIMELDNLSLEVVPELRLTNNGLVDVASMSFVDVVLG
ncbi:adenine deaminase C-terminal domain-containing protein [Natrinema gelatinilyticum]|uniref:adenine deaminase C-terminal domain-containing protein n=1 Tax=Natrinema gelatinilyticum TaxID=2961571 RepID=UPI0020C43DB8|nr:adenine deaminase C-terminal domain-containing protein [Natrinema gelatinilyticum]